MYREANFSFRVSKKLQRCDLWNEKRTLTNKLTDRQTGWILHSCPHAYRVVIQASSLWTSSPHTALGPCQIYCYPLQTLIRDLERDFAESFGILAVSFLLISARRNDEKQRSGYHCSHEEQISLTGDACKLSDAPIFCAGNWVAMLYASELTLCGSKYLSFFSSHTYSQIEHTITFERPAFTFVC